MRIEGAGEIKTTTEVEGQCAEFRNVPRGDVQLSFRVTLPPPRFTLVSHIVFETNS